MFLQAKKMIDILITFNSENCFIQPWVNLSTIAAIGFIVNNWKPLFLFKIS